MDRTKMQQTLVDIVDTFAGGDGGIGYFKFRCLCEGMEKRAAEGDADAAQICDVVYRFKKLIDVAATR